MMNEKPELEMIESPCLGQCGLNEENICPSCYRSLEEITSWITVDNDTRRQYLENIAKRKSQEMADQ